LPCILCANFWELAFWPKGAYLYALIENVAWETAEVFVGLTQAAVRNSPEFYPSRPVSEDYESVLSEHYGRPR